MFGWPSCTPNWGPGPQPRHMPRLGIEPVTLWLTSLHSIHWTTPGRAKCFSLKSCEEFEISLHLQTKKWPSHSFLCAGRRYETLGSKTKEWFLLTAAAAARISAFLHKFTKPQLPQVMWKGLDDTCPSGVLNYRRGTWNLKNLDLA